MTASLESTNRKSLSPGRVAIACLIGTLVEIYDFILFAFVATLVIGPLFFPNSEPWLGTLLALTSNAVAFFFRPLGAVIFGAIGDKYGRRRALMGSLTLMGLGTAAVGLMPTYATIGVAAPILLVLLRVVQGIAVGGEWGGAVTVAVEHAPPERKVLYGSMPQIGAVLGLGLAVASLLLIQTTVDQAAFLAWGWRVPFLAGALLIVLGVLIRRRLEETPEFQAAAERPHERSGIVETVRLAGPRIIGTALTWMSVNVVVYALMTGLLAYAPTYVEGLSSTDVQVGLIACAVVLVGYALAASHLARRVDSHTIIWVSGAITALWAFPAFWLVGTGNPVLLWVAMLIGVIPYGLANGTLPTLMSEYFPARLRYTGVAVAFASANVIGGALLPIPALAFVEEMGGSSVPLSVAMLIGGLATIAGVVLLRRIGRGPRLG